MSIQTLAARFPNTEIIYCLRIDRTRLVLTVDRRLASPEVIVSSSNRICTRLSTCIEVSSQVSKYNSCSKNGPQDEVTSCYTSKSSISHIMSPNKVYLVINHSPTQFLRVSAEFLVRTRKISRPKTMGLTKDASDTQ